MNATVTAELPGTRPYRNGLPWKPYVYRGTNEDTLTPELDDLPDEPPAPRELAPCGSAAAYRRHRRNGEPIDEECRLAENRRCADRKATT